MKKSKIKFLLLAIPFALLTSCGGGGETSDQTGPEYTSKYVCPMHCEGSGDEEPGNCPVCGMEYVENENHSHGE